MPEPDWFETTFARSAVGALLLGPDRRVLRTNASFLQLLGSREEVAGRPTDEVLHAGQDRIIDAADRARREGRSISVSNVILEPAGRRRRRRVDLEVIPQHGEAAGAGTTLVLLTDRTASHSGWADPAHLFYEAFLHSTNAMELTDRDGFLVDVNPAFERIYGYTKEELIGGRPSLVSSPSTSREVYVRMWKDLLDPNLGAWTGEIVNRDRQGVEHPVLLAINAVRDREGSISHFLGVAVDLTERRALELQAMHSERLASLGQLSAGVAHEINTPLANIMLIAESVRRKSNDPWVAGRLNSLLEQAESAARIVRGLLEFGRRPEVQVGEVDLNPLAEHVVSFLRGKQSADVEVDLELSPTPVLVRADREQLSQVLSNLLNNAYDAVEGAGRIRVTVENDGTWAHLRVSDSGAGIPDEVRAHLFEPFFTTKPEGKGTGLGLAICHGIVESHGGAIEVESTVGKGTTFDVRLPSLKRPAN
jgi:two-component system, cell cycle sensor histidine kinase and response regulator CckA